MGFGRVAFWVWGATGCVCGLMGWAFGLGGLDLGIGEGWVRLCGQILGWRSDFGVGMGFGVFFWGFGV